MHQNVAEKTDFISPGFVFELKEQGGPDRPEAGSRDPLFCIMIYLFRIAGKYRSDTVCSDGVYRIPPGLVQNQLLQKRQLIPG
jgi:hypothetical protein